MFVAAMDVTLLAQPSNELPGELRLLKGSLPE